MLKILAGRKCKSSDCFFNCSQVGRGRHSIQNLDIGAVVEKHATHQTLNPNHDRLPILST